MSETSRIYAKLCADVGRELFLAAKSEKAAFIASDRDGIHMMEGAGGTFKTFAVLLAALGYEAEITLHRIKAPALGEKE